MHDTFCRIQLETVRLIETENATRARHQLPAFDQADCDGAAMESTSASLCPSQTDDQELDRERLADLSKNHFGAEAIIRVHGRCRRTRTGVRARL